MESILQGWLVKSPPEKKTVGSWKIFGAKWRRRYFVLYAPPAVEGVHVDSSAAILEYYSNKKLHHKHGTIDLSKCEEVYSALDSAMYKNVFCIQTIHKSRNRTYYLAAETEAEMTKWVNTLCQILGLTESEETPPLFLPNLIEAKIQQILQPYTTGRPLTQLPVKPQPNYSTHPKQLSPELAVSRPITMGCPRSGSEPNLLDACSPSRSTDMSARSVNDHWAGSPPSGLRNAGSVSELDLLSSKRNMPLHDGPPPLPPERGRTPQQQSGLEYDRPSPNYKDEGVRDASGVFYDLPPGKATKVDMAGCADDNFYNTPPSQLTMMNKSHVHAKDQNTVPDDGSCYDVPPGGNKLGGERPSKKTIKKSVDEVVENELYNVPRQELDNGKHSRIMNSIVYVNHDLRSGNTDVGSDELYNVPRVPNDAGKNKKGSVAPPIAAVDSEQLYNVPREQLPGRDKKSKEPVNASTTSVDEVYNVPREQIRSGRANEKYVKGTSSNNNARELHGEYAPLSTQAVADQYYETPPVKQSPQNRGPTGKEQAEPKKSVNPGQVRNTADNSADDTYNVPPSSLNHSKVEHSMLKMSLSHGQSTEPGDQTYDIPPQVGVSSTQFQSGGLMKTTPDRHNDNTVSDETYDVPSKIPPVPAKKHTPAPPKPPRPEPGSVVMKPQVVNVSAEMKADLRGSMCGFIVAESSIAQREQDPPLSYKNEGAEKDVVSELSSGANKMRFQQKESFHSASGATPPCIAKKATPTVEVRDSIRFTQRSKSFKRSLPSQQRSDLPLPIKRIVERSESSSSDDDD